MTDFVTTPDHRVTVMRDSLLEFPELWLEVYISPDTSDTRELYRFINMFTRAKCTRALTPETADLVVFGGGSDVNPIFYDETPHKSTRWDAQRDQADIELYETCYNLGVPMFGVCRGAQFLHVMNGGKLFQDIDNHVGDHPIWDVKDQRLINKVSSVHHQCCISNRAGGMTLLADSPKASIRWRNDKDKVMGNMKDVEAFFYRDTHCLGVQGHPEYDGYGEFMKWTLNKIYDYIVNSPDVDLPRDAEGKPNGRYRRIKPEFLNERNARAREALKELMKEAN